MPSDPIVEAGPAGHADPVSGHGGFHVIAAAQAHGVKTLFTLSGAHIFPLYDAALGGRDSVAAAGGSAAALAGNAAADGGGGVRLVDVRHEQSAVFAAEATAKLTRTPGFAALTAGPGVTNGISAIASASFNAAPIVVFGGRAPAFRWGSGALQEIDHPPLLAPITKRAFTADDPTRIGADVADAFALARSPRRGPVFVDSPMDRLYTPAEAVRPVRLPDAVREADPDLVASAARAIATATKPVLVLSSDVWSDGAEASARQFAEAAGIPVITTGMGRGILPRGHRLLVTRARAHAFRAADLVIVAGAPLDFRLNYGIFGDPSRPTPVIHMADSAAGAVGGAASPEVAPAQRVQSVTHSLIGDMSRIFEALAESAAPVRAHTASDWAEDLKSRDAAARAADASDLSSDRSPIHPARIYGELLPRLADDAVVIGDGGDFVSFAGRYVEPAQAGNWLDPGPYGCLGTGLGYAIAARIARPSAQVVLLLGDGAAGFSLMDLDTLVRHRLQVTIIVGNNSAWGLEKHPMRFLHGYDALADLGLNTRYDLVAKALGADAELVAEASGIGPAIARGLASEMPYLVNILTDPDVAYPRSTTGL